MRTIIVVLIVAALAVNAKKLPEQLSKLLCSKSVPNYEKCMSKNMQSIVSIFVKGIPELHVPPMNPLKIPKMNVSSEFGSFGKVNGFLKNLVVEGLDGTKVDSFTADLQTLSGVLNLTIPSLTETMQYDLDAIIVQSPFLSKGVLKGKFAEIKLMFSANLKRVNRENTEYFEVDDLNLEVSVGNGKLEIITDDPKKQETANYMTNMYNKNFQTILKLFSSFLIEKSKPTIQNYVNLYASKAPAEEWLPE